MAERRPRRTLRRLVRRPIRTVIAGVALMIGVGMVGTDTAPVGAQAGPVGAFGLRSVTLWHAPEQDFTMGLEVQTATPGTLEVTATVYRAVTSRSEFNQTLEGRIAGGVVARGPAVGVSDLDLDVDGRRTYSFSPALSGEGVYPVRVEVRRKGGGTRFNAFVTYVVHVPQAPVGPRLDVSWVLRLHAPPALASDGTVAIAAAKAEALSELAAALNRRPDVAVTLAPTPETFAAMATDGDETDRATLAALVSATRGRQVLGGPYVDLDPTAIVEAGLEDEAATQLAYGTATLRALVGTEPTTSTRLVDRPLSEAALASLQSEPQPVQRVVMPEALLEPIVTNTSLTETFELESRRGRVRAAMADDGLAAHFEAANPALAASQLLADLAVLYFDRPGTPRGVVMAAPAGRRLAPEFLDGVLDGLASSPILQATTLDQHFTDVPVASSPTRRGEPSTPLLRRFAAPAPGTASPALPAAGIRDARRRVQGFASAIESANPVLDRMERTLLVASAADLPGADRTRYLDSVMSQVAQEVKGITMPGNRSITLTARQGEIPFTVTNRLAYPLRAVLKVGSDTLEFPEGSDRPLELLRRNTTAQVTVQAQSSGSFPLRVRLETPNGMVLAESRFTVRSTAVSGVGTALSIGAAGFLLVWWGNHLRGRRSRRLVPTG